MDRPRFDIVASGARMKAIRQQRHISVKQVMEYMGFESTQAVYKWEAGKCYPQADNLVALAILYNVSPLELLVEEDLVSSSGILRRELWRHLRQFLHEKVSGNFWSRRLQERILILS
jgi:transcriptional regulator with XRE-family HTH domain